MYFGYERASRVDHMQVFAFGKLKDLRRDAVRAEDADRAVRYLLDAVNEYHIAAAQVINYIPVVNDFVKDIDGWRVIIERAFDYINRANHARAKAARLCQYHFSNRHSVNPCS
jgi:hypothetical protein